jgi:hypothetical protein
MSRKQFLGHIEDRFGNPANTIGWELFELHSDGDDVSTEILSDPRSHQEKDPLTPCDRCDYLISNDNTCGN